MPIAFNGNYEILDNYTELDEDTRELMESAIVASEKSYSPYSLFAIGAAVRLRSGKIITGSNQENIAFPTGLCAERVVLHTVMHSYPTENILSLAIIAKSQDLWTSEPISPCGACRQTMLQVVMRQEESFSIYLGSKENETLYIPRAEYLLPLAFTHEDLKK